jgi:hypothetical protein
VGVADWQPYRSFSDDELRRLVAASRSLKDLARERHWNYTPFHAYCKRHQILTPFNGAGAQHEPEATAPLPGDEISREEKLQQRNAELERRVRAVRAEEVRQERTLEIIRHHLETKRPSYKPTALRGSRLDTHTMVLLWSDAHAAETVSPEETQGINAYDWREMMRRHDELRRGIVSYVQHRSYKVDKLIVLGLGDMLSGNIHDELAETNEMPLAEAAVQFGLDGAEFLESLVPHFPAIEFHGVVGNHPRAHRKPRAKQKHDNADWIAYQIMRQRLAQVPSITWSIPRGSRALVNVYGRRILALHGDGIRSTMVSVPWGGIIRLAEKLRNEYAAAGIAIDHFALGHYHEANSVKNRRILMNGSIKGVDEFSLERFGGGEPPTQLLLSFHPKRGLADVSYIDLRGDAE